MILLAECIIGCLVFGAAVVGSVLANKTLWLHDNKKICGLAE